MTDKLKRYLCISCGQVHLYMILRCTVCESDKIRKEEDTIYKKKNKWM